MSRPFAVLAVTAAAGLAALSVLMLPLRSAEAEGQVFAPVTDAVTQKECSACHMAFPAPMLPARSWTAVMGGLKTHFGENAELDAATTQHITDYLVANAADAKGAKPRTLRGLDAAVTPLRITETPWWDRAHGREVSPAAFKNPKVGSKANCTACHAGAAKGVFEDD